MEKGFNKLIGMLLCVAMVAALMPMATTRASAESDIVAYAVEGGNIYFDKATGTITDCDETVTAADIPRTIEDVPVISIGKKAFFYTRLTSVNIPDSVMSIGEMAFYFCYDLTSIMVSAGNNVYSSLDGVLFNKDLTELIQYPSGKVGDYSIPNGVLSICEGAFWASKLTSVSIPNSVKSIGEWAFFYTRLTSVSIPDSVMSIGKGAFSDCADLTSIMVSPENNAYSSADGVLFSKDMTELIHCPAGKDGNYTIPSSVTRIGAEAFSFSALTSVSIPNGVTSIGDAAFEGCLNLISVNIPSSVTSISNGAFYSNNLNVITVDEGNTVYSSEDGVLFNKAKTKLITFPCGRNDIDSIPRSVTCIGEGAFWECRTLNNIEIPEGITHIERYAFNGCRYVKSVTISSSVISIDEYAFHYLDKLQDVYYAGSEAEWNAISIIEEGNEDLLNATIHYNSSSPSGLIKLATPTDLAWDPDCPGFITWKNNMPPQNEFRIRIYREHETVHIGEEWYGSGSDYIEQWEDAIFRELSSELDSGNYYFTVQSTGDESVYSYSEVATSEVWTYVKPSAKLPSIDSLSFQWPEAVFGFSDIQSTWGSYWLEWYFSATSDGEKRRDTYVYGSQWLSNEKQYKTKIPDRTLRRCGEGYYFFRVRLMSDDITQIQNGPWSEFSEPYYYSGADIAQQLNDIAQTGGTDEEIRDAVQNLDRDALRTAMLADTQGTGAVATMAELEEGLSTTFTVESTVGAFDESDVAVVGALLNPVTSNQVVLNIGRPQTEHVLPTLYNQSLAIQFSMDLNGVENTNNLAVPIVMTLPVPATINPDFLAILHYPAGGGDPEKIGLSQYYLYQEGGQWFVRFVLDHFSDFAMTEELPEGHKVILSDYTNGGATVSGLVSGSSYSGAVNFTVSCANACVVAYTTDGGATYTRLSGSGSGDTRSFTVDVTQDMTIMVALKGDLNLDGKVALADAAQAKRYCAGLRTLTAEQMLAADVVIDGEIKLADAAQIQRFCAGLRTFEW